MELVLSATMVGRKRGWPATTLCSAARPDPAWMMSSYAAFGPIGPGRAVAVGREIDQARIDLLERLVLHAQPLGRLGAIVVHQHVGGLGELEQRVAAGVLLEVEHDRALGAIAAEIERRHAGIARRPELARGVALGRLDFHHIGARDRPVAALPTAPARPSCNRESERRPTDPPCTLPLSSNGFIRLAHQTRARPQIGHALQNGCYRQHPRTPLHRETHQRHPPTNRRL